MFASLRRKFIAIILIVVGLVMALIFAGMCLTKYQTDEESVRAALRDAATAASLQSEPNEASLAQDFMRSEKSQSAVFGEPREYEAAEDTDDEQQATSNMGSVSAESRELPIKPSEIHVGRPEGTISPSFIPVAAYRLADDGSFDLVSEAGIASVSEEVSISALEDVKTAPDGYGRLNNLGLVFYKSSSPRQASYIAFTDIAYTDGWQELAQDLGLLWVTAMIALFTVSLLLARWALMPVKEAWDSQRQFVADASHDLKTPLTVILANMSILLQSPEKTIASESQWIENTQKEANGMQELVCEMLELAQVETAPETLNMQREDLGKIVEGQCLIFDGMALEQGCIFDWDVPKNLFVTGDAAKLSKMFKTLLENAFKYTGVGGHIDVHVSTFGKKAKIAISNDGAIIPKKDLPHIFKRFYRSDKVRTSGSGSFGLGLAIAREIAIKHEGDISCESSEEKGTTFTVSLPLVS